MCRAGKGNSVDPLELMGWEGASKVFEEDWSEFEEGVVLCAGCT